jgi:hypothetical protein
MWTLSDLHSKKKDNFNNILKDVLLKKFRDDLFIFLIERSDENDFFDLNIYSKYNQTIRQEIYNKIKLEIESLGWKVKLSYGDTGMFIYSTEKPPPSCW